MEEESELRERAKEERRAIVEKYDLGREDGAVIDDWEDPKLEIYHTQDRFGFIHDERLPDYGRTERERKQLDKEMARVKKWLDMTADEKNFFDKKGRKRETMEGRVWKGVPQRMRGAFWYIILGIKTLKEQQKDTYRKMKLLAREKSPDIRQIDLDVNRTYRNHSMFRERYNVRQQDLFHVLAAYSMYNTDVGYCQGMSQVAALLLMYLSSEEDAFWALHKLMIGDLYKMHGFFIPGFPKLIRFQAHFDKILSKKLRRVQKHLIKHEVDSSIFTLKWFFQCFLDRLPFSLVIRVWDLYLLRGEEIMFAMGYTILKLHRSKLLKMNMDDLLEFLQKKLETNFGFEEDFVIEEALKENLHELKSSHLHSAGGVPENEEPTKPFGSSLLPSVAVELGYRQPFTSKERELSQYQIQRDIDAKNLQYLDGQTSIDEGSIDQSLNETASLGPETEDRHSEILDQNVPFLSDNSLDSPTRSRTGTPHRSRTGSTSYSSSRNLQMSEHESRSSRHDQLGPPSPQPVLPPSPLPPSSAQDMLDESLVFLMKSANISEINHPARPASADQHLKVNKFKPQHKENRHSAHVHVTDYRHANTRLDSSFDSVGSGRSGHRDSSEHLRISQQGEAERRHHARSQQQQPAASSSSSKRANGSKTHYYYGENVRQEDTLVNGHDEDILNSSFESATPHTGEVVRIKVRSNASEIERQDMEISPRYNGHKVTIQVNQSERLEESSSTSTSTTGLAMKSSSYQERHHQIKESSRSSSSSRRHTSTSDRKGARADMMEDARYRSATNMYTEDGIDPKVEQSPSGHRLNDQQQQHYVRDDGLGQADRSQHLPVIGGRGGTRPASFQENGYRAQHSSSSRKRETFF